MDLEREKRSVRMWYDITNPEELVEAIKGVKRRSDLGPVKISVPRSRVNAFKEDGLITPKVAEELRQHLELINKKRK